MPPCPAGGMKLSLAKTGKLAQVFNADESSDEEEIPPEARYGALRTLYYYPSLPLMAFRLLLKRRSWVGG